MTILLLKGYNNYFNRIVKQESSITAYKQASTSYLEYPNVNFDPQDGIMTSLVVGGETQAEIILDNRQVLRFDDLGSPDYLIVHDNTNIASKWFVMESVKIRQGQYKLALKRDVLADFYADYIEAPCYVEKGFVNDIQNPLLYNPENLRVNEIKQNETLIKDWSQCAWLVGYMKKDAQATVSGTLAKDLSKYTSYNALTFKDCINYIEDGEVTQSATKTAVSDNGNTMVYFKINHRPAYAYEANIKGYSNMINKPFRVDTLNNNSYNGVNSCVLDSSQDGWNADDAYKKDIEKINNLVNSTASQKFNSLVTVCSAEVFTQNAIIKVDDILTHEGQLIQKGNKLYKLHIEKSETNSSYRKTFTFNNVTAGDTAGLTFFTEIANGINTLSLITTNPTSQKFSVSYEANTYSIIAVETAVPETVTAIIPAASNRRTTNDALYDIFAIPYNPDPTVAYKFKYNNVEYILDSEVSLLMANMLITQLGLGDAGSAYDLQLLPYCPLKDYARYGYPINCGYGSDKTFSIIEDANHNAYSFICFPEEANFSTNIPFTKNYKKERTSIIDVQWTNVTATWNGDGLLYTCEVPLTDLPQDVFNLRGNMDITWNNITIPCYPYGTSPETEDPVAEWAYGFLGQPTVFFWIYNIDYIPNVVIFDEIVGEISYSYYIAPSVLEMKVNNECDFMRLTSPNYNGMYQFKLSKLQDGIHYINVDCTYKPVNPYIKLNPDYSFLYGQDFNDSVGLILGGDFSLPLLTDPWNQYELQNKNYQNIFNRSIQDLDVNQRIAREQQEFQGALGIISAGIVGAGSGAYAGAKAGAGMGAGVGAAAGLAAGTALGAVGFEKDREWLRQQQGEAKSYAQDNFSYQLGTIQALPETVSKSSPLTYNNKIWPILEEFSCTDIEKEVVRNKIVFDGMSIMAIGKLSDYNNSSEVSKVFLKGKLIRVEDIDDDFHIVDALYQEVEKGFYTEGD